METLLSVKDLSVTYHNKRKKVYAARNVNFDIARGDSLGVVGESGSGKSTIAMAILRLLDASGADVTGEALFQGRDLIAMPEKELNELRWKDIAVVFQKAMNTLSPVHRIGNQILDIYRTHEPEASKDEIFERAGAMLRLVNLNERVYRLYPHELSGGMLQRVAIAISLLHKPSLLIMDEATTALDVVTQGQILSEIKEMEETLHTTRIMITHDMSVVATTCSHMAVMYAGVIVEQGPTYDVIKTPAHPYTQGLLGSFPSLHYKKDKLDSIGGFLPSLSEIGKGCVFAPRCPYAEARCYKEVPEARELESGRMASCHIAGR